MIACAQEKERSSAISSRTRKEARRDLTFSDEHSVSSDALEDRPHDGRLRKRVAVVENAEESRRRTKSESVESRGRVVLLPLARRLTKKELEDPPS